jgi:hypothetical protein
MLDVKVFGASEAMARVAARLDAMTGSTPGWELIRHVEPPEEAPNVLVVLIDDAGFGNPGTFGGPRRRTSCQARMRATGSAATGTSPSAKRTSASATASTRVATARTSAATAAQRRALMPLGSGPRRASAWRPRDR